MENKNCEKWKKHKFAGRKYDSFTCYQKLENNIAFIQKNGVDEFEREQKLRQELLKEIMKEFIEGCSKA